MLTLPFYDDPIEWLSRFNTTEFPVLLDAGGHERGRYDIIAASPTESVLLYSDRLEHHSKNGLKIAPPEQFFDTIKRMRQPVDHGSELPFVSGLIGFIGYDIAHVVESIEQRDNKPSPDLPVACLRRYEWAIIQDREQKCSYFTTTDVNLSGELEKRTANRRNDDPISSSIWHSDTSRSEYITDLERILEYIRAGDCYQVNYTQRFSTVCSADALSIYRRVRASVSSPFSAFIPIDAHRAVISVSPERFVTITNGSIVTQPIKGTIARSEDDVVDRQRIERLQHSIKDRAENVMIVDLMRNDLGRVSKVGSVKVDKLFEVETYKNVHHLVSTVSSQLDDAADMVDVLRATLPGGSITGAPKIRSMEVIEELERTRRSAYCGSVCYLSDHGRMDSSITIRTLVKDHDNLYIWGGGGIVADSDIELEQQESRAKIRAFIEALNGRIADELEDG
jgi:para-aminobenzoate synthetase component 1